MKDTYSVPCSDLPKRVPPFISSTAFKSDFNAALSCSQRPESYEPNTTPRSVPSPHSSLTAQTLRDSTAGLLIHNLLAKARGIIDTKHLEDNARKPAVIVKVRSNLGAWYQRRKYIAQRPCQEWKKVNCLAKSRDRRKVACIDLVPELRCVKDTILMASVLPARP